MHWSYPQSGTCVMSWCIHRNQEDLVLLHINQSLGYELNTIYKNKNAIGTDNKEIETSVLVYKTSRDALVLIYDDQRNALIRYQKLIVI